MFLPQIISNPNVSVETHGIGLLSGRLISKKKKSNFLMAFPHTVSKGIKILMDDFLKQVTSHCAGKMCRVSLLCGSGEKKILTKEARNKSNYVIEAIKEFIPVTCKTVL